MPTYHVKFAAIVTRHFEADNIAAVAGEAAMIVKNSSSEVRLISIIEEGKETPPEAIVEELKLTPLERLVNGMRERMDRMLHKDPPPPKDAA